jgi:hypothetical protein
VLLQIEKKLSTEYFCHHVNRNKKLFTTLAKFLVGRQTTAGNNTMDVRMKI